jgi:hypothetical protein
MFIYSETGHSGDKDVDSELTKLVTVLSYQILENVLKYFS